MRDRATPPFPFPKDPPPNFNFFNKLKRLECYSLETTAPRLPFTCARWRAQVKTITPR
ncbi:hypothetical protein ACRRTK_000271 [Alexandromys fortis]